MENVLGNHSNNETNRVLTIMSDEHQCTSI